MTETTTPRVSVIDLDPHTLFVKHSTQTNPLAATPLGELVVTFLDSQQKIGIRQFAERARLTRKRLKEIMDGDALSEAESDAIQSVFADISARYDQKNAKKSAGR